MVLEGLHGILTILANRLDVGQEFFEASLEIGGVIDRHHQLLVEIYGSVVCRRDGEASEGNFRGLCQLALVGHHLKREKHAAIPPEVGRSLVDEHESAVLFVVVQRGGLRQTLTIDEDGIALAVLLDAQSFGQRDGSLQSLHGNLVVEREFHHVRAAILRNRKEVGSDAEIPDREICEAHVHGEVVLYGLFSRRIAEDHVAELDVASEEVVFSLQRQFEEHAAVAIDRIALVGRDEEDVAVPVLFVLERVDLVFHALFVSLGLHELQTVGQRHVCLQTIDVARLVQVDRHGNGLSRCQGESIHADLTVSHRHTATSGQRQQRKGVAGGKAVKGGICNFLHCR